MKLDNQRHERFAVLVSRGTSARAAYVKAGYADDISNAQRLTTLIDVKERIAELQERIAKRSEVSASYVLTHTKELLERCLQKKQVMVKGEDGSMIPSGEWKFDSAGAAKALDIIAKSIGMFNHIQRSQVTVSQVRDELSEMPETDFQAVRAIMLKARESKHD